LTQALDPDEQPLMADPRFEQAVALFNAGEWYACHDGFEALWHECQGPSRKALQGILQIAVSQLHLQRGNQRGATVLLGEGLGRLAGYGPVQLGLDLDQLRRSAQTLLAALQRQQPTDALPAPQLRAAPTAGDGDPAHAGYDEPH
jgi:predicted metal-dependent hydrolase